MLMKAWYSEKNSQNLLECYGCLLVRHGLSNFCLKLGCCVDNVGVLSFAAFELEGGANF